MAGGRKKPFVGLRAMDAEWLVGEDGSEPTEEVSRSANRQTCEQYESPAVGLSQCRQPRGKQAESMATRYEMNEGEWGIWKIFKALRL